MKLGTIIIWLLDLIGLFRDKGRSRIKIDVRSEQAIEDERKNLDKIYARLAGIDNELKSTIHKIVKAKMDGDTSLESCLNDKRDFLLQQFRDTQREYINLKGRYD